MMGWKRSSGQRWICWQEKHRRTAPHVIIARCLFPFTTIIVRSPDELKVLIKHPGTAFTMGNGNRRLSASRSSPSPSIPPPSRGRRFGKRNFQVKKTYMRKVTWVLIFAYLSVSGCAGINTCSDQETVNKAFCPYSIRNQGLDIIDTTTEPEIKICVPLAVNARTFVVGTQDGELRVKSMYEDIVSPQLAYGEDVVISDGKCFWNPHLDRKAMICGWEDENCSSPFSRISFEGAAGTAILVTYVATGGLALLLGLKNEVISTSVFQDIVRDLSIPVYFEDTASLPGVAKTRLSIVKVEGGDRVSIPAGSFVRYHNKTVFKPFAGRIMEGRIEPLYKTRNDLIFLTNTPVALYAEAKNAVSHFPEGSLLNHDDYLVTKDRRVIYVDHDQGRGFLDGTDLAKIVDSAGNLVVTSAEAELKASLNGQVVDTIGMGTNIGSLLFVPTLGVYRVQSEYGRGWIDRASVMTIEFEEVDEMFIALRDTPIIQSPRGEKAVGFLFEGEETAISKKVKGSDLYVIETEHMRGYVRGENLLKLERSEGAGWAAFENMPLLQAPGGTKIGEIPAQGPLESLAEAGVYSKVRVKSTGQTGWITRDALTEAMAGSDGTALPLPKKSAAVQEEGFPRLFYSLAIVDENKNGIFEAGENIALFMRAVNSGMGTAHAVRLEVQDALSLDLPPAIDLGDIRPGQTLEKTFPFRLPHKISGDRVVMTHLLDRQGYAASPKALSFVAVDHELPKLSVRYALNDADGRLHAGEEAKMFIYLTNEGGPARDISVDICCPEEIVITGGEQRSKIMLLPKGESKELQISILAPSRYAERSKSIPFRISLHSPTVNMEKNIQIPLGE
jgi:hypothetical protein